MASKVIKNPEIEYRAGWMTITEVELTKEATIIRGILGQGSSIINNTVLRDRNSGKEYKFLRVEGIKAHEQAVDGTTCSVYFEPLDAEVKEFNYIEVGNNMLGNYYGIKLQSKTKQSKRKVSNSGAREVISKLRLVTRFPYTNLMAETSKEPSAKIPSNCSNRDLFSKAMR